MVSAHKPGSGNGGLHIGDHVTFLFGVKRLTGEIVEDRGKVGIGGRQLFLVEVQVEYGDPMRLELPEDELEFAPKAAK